MLDGLGGSYKHVYGEMPLKIANCPRLLAIYPRHISEIPSPLIWSTLARPISATGITLARHQIFPPLFLSGHSTDETDIWSLASCNAVLQMCLVVWHNHGYILKKPSETCRVGFPGSAILARVICNTLARYRTVCVVYVRTQWNKWYLV